MMSVLSLGASHKINVLVQGNIIAISDTQKIIVKTFSFQQV